MGKASNVVRFKGIENEQVCEGMRLLSERAVIEDLPGGSEVKAMRLVQWAVEFRKYKETYGLGRSA
jgi:hypothetical protein